MPTAAAVENCNPKRKATVFRARHVAVRGGGIEYCTGNTPGLLEIVFWNKSALSLGSPGAGLPTCVDPLLGLACKLASKNIEPGICRAFLWVVGTGARYCLNHDFFD
jgi:hypothetical protein